MVLRSGFCWIDAGLMLDWQRPSPTLHNESDLTEWVWLVLYQLRHIQLNMMVLPTTLGSSTIGTEKFKG
jgi:hypothetical protein